MSESVSSAESSIYCADHPKFGEELLHLLEQNDPSLKVMEITGCDISYLDVDWEKRGGAFANNTHLQYLYIELDHHGDAARDHNIKAFYRALASNRSMSSLFIHSSLDNDDAKSMFEELLTPFFRDNDVIRSFEFAGDINFMTSQWLVSALASNKKSLRKITLSGGGKHMAKVIDEIATHENIKVLSLYVFTEEKDDMIHWCTAVGKLLNNPLSKLEELILEDETIIEDEGLIIIGSALSSNTTLKRISRFNSIIQHNNQQSTTIIPNITSSGWESFFGYLANSSLEELLLSHRNISDEALAVLGTSLPTMNTLKVLSLSDNELITSQGWEIFLGIIVDSCLEELDLDYNGISDEALAVFVNSLAEMSTLKVLSLEENELITEQGWLHFFNQLHDFPSLTLESLDISGNVFGVEGNASIFYGLMNMQSLKNLDVSCRDPDSESLDDDPRMALTSDSFLSLLRCHAPNLEHLSVSVLDVNEELITGLAASLVGNTSLKSVDIENKLLWRLGYDDDPTLVGWDALNNALCDNTSIESIICSNHTLQEINFTQGGYEFQPFNPDEEEIDSDYGSVQETRHSEAMSTMDSYLELNKSGDDKTEVARQKIIQYYFDNGDRNIQEIVDMEISALPYAIEWSGRNEASLSLLYRLLRSVPYLFE